MKLRCTIIAVALLILTLPTSLTNGAPPDKEPVDVHGGRYRGMMIARVDVKTPDQLAMVSANSVTVLADTPGLRPLDIVATQAQLDALGDAGLTVKVTQPDLQKLINEQFEQAAGVVDDPFEDWFLSYHDFDSGSDSVLWYLEQLTLRYPDLCAGVFLGTTLQGRGIYGIRIANDSVPGYKPGVVYFGCEHAREWITTTIPPYFANYLLENYGTDPVATDLVDHLEFFLVPVMNADGYEYTWNTYRLWRKNRRNNGDGTYGVDLNRNWGEGWGGPGSDGNTSSETYRGPAPFSEPETQVMRDFFLNHPNVRAQLDIHSYSQLILWPYGYTSALPADQDVYEDIGYAMQSLIQSVHGKYYSAGNIYTGIYPASGGSVDWTYAQLGILSYTYECRDTGSYGFELPANQIIPQNEELLPAILHLTDSDWVRAPVRYEFPQGVPGTADAGSYTTFNVELIPQYEQLVPGSAMLHYRLDPAGAFVAEPLTPLGSDLYQAILPQANCWSQPEFYLTLQGDGGSTWTSPRNAPAGGTYHAAVATGSTVFFEELMDTDPGWTAESYWAFGQPTGGGGDHGETDPTSGYTGNNVYGYNLNGDYSRYLPERYLTTLPIDCTGREGVELSFWRWLGVEQPQYDKAALQVSNDGSSWTTVWQNTEEVTDSDWTYQEFDISAVADGQPTVYIRWVMGPTDGGWEYCGWNIDDVRLSAAGCAGLRGDHNGDTVIDLQDAAALADCMAGPQGGLLPNCAVFDFAEDEDVDFKDAAQFQNTFGPTP